MMDMIAGSNVQSPFLPGTNIQYAWDSTSLGYLKTCPRLYQYIIIEGWGSREESVHLRFGSEYHTAIEQYDKAKAAGATHKAAMHDAIRELVRRTIDWKVDTTTPAGKYKNRLTLLEIVIDYLDNFKDDAAETYIRENGAAAVELSFRFELDWGPQHKQEFYGDKFVDKKMEIGQPYLLCGHLDRVVNFNDSLFVMDHKTSKTTIGDYFFDQFAPNNQMTLYALAGKVVINSPISGVIIDAAQILLEKPHSFKRGMTYRTPDQLDEWLDDLSQWLSQAEAYAVNNYWPMNDTACDKYGGCKFREICAKSPSVRERFLRSEFRQEAPWNPLAIKT